MNRRRAAPLSQAKVVVLTNFIAPYRLPVLEALAERVGDLRVWLSTPMEPNRPWRPQWGRLRVEVQRSVTIEHPSRHPHGYRESELVHLPFDTLPRLRRARPDIVMSGELGARTAQAALYCLLSSTPLVVWVTVSESSEKGRGPVRRLLRRALLPRADVVIVNGRSGQRYVRALGARSERVVTVPQTSHPGPAPVPDGQVSRVPRHLLYVGQLIERKGLVPFVAALGRWGRRHLGEQVTLEIVGDGPEWARLAAVDLPGNVVLRRSGQLPYERMAEVYAKAGVLAFPTLADEWGVVVNEAMAAGLPVLGSVYSQAVEELVEDGVNGWLFRPDRPDEVDAVLDRVLRVGAPELARMGAAARGSVQFLTPEFAAERVVSGLKLVADR
jgi:glycosyltransferase involved in cell wall biosynthesis